MRLARRKVSISSRVCVFGRALARSLEVVRLMRTVAYVATVSDARATFPMIKPRFRNQRGEQSPFSGSAREAR